MSLERKITDEEAKKIIGQKKAALRNLGYSSEEISSIMFETEKEYSNYLKSFKLTEQGHGSGFVGRKLGVDSGKVLLWTKGRQIPFLLFHPAKYSRNAFCDSPETASSIVGLLAYLSSTRQSVDFDHFSSYFKEEKILKPFLRATCDVLSVVPEVDKGKYFHLNFKSFYLRKLFKEKTIDNTIIPWELLDTLEKKETYLHWFFSYGKGHVTYRKYKDKLYPRLDFSFPSHRELQQEFAVLLFDLGFLPNFRGSKVELLRSEDFKRLTRPKFCSSEIKRKSLEDALIHFDDTDEDIMPPGVIVRLHQEIDSGRMSKPEALDHLCNKGVRKGQAKSWLYNRLPRNAQRYIKVSQLVKIRDTFLYVHNMFGLGISFSRTLANSFSLEEINHIAYGDFFYSVDAEDDFNAKLNLLAWNTLINPSNKDTSSYDSRELIYLKDLFNMYVSDSYLDNKDMLNIVYSQLYRQISQSPRLAEFTEIVDDQLYVVNRSDYVSLVESLLGKAGLGGKKRRLADARRLTEKLRI